MATEEIAPEDALAMADMTTDITGVVSRGKKYKESKNAGINKTETEETTKVEPVEVI